MGFAQLTTKRWLVARHSSIDVTYDMTSYIPGFNFQMKRRTFTIENF